MGAELVTDPSLTVGRIDSFRGGHAWLSNDSDHAASYDGVEYPTGEHAFAAAKTVDAADRARIASCATPGEAKASGRRVTLRAGWDQTVRYQAMDAILASKFADGALGAASDATGDSLLVEGNAWHDQTWGDCTCAKHASWPGRNSLSDGCLGGGVQS